MVSKVRSQRIADRICQELAEMMVKDVSDPRLAGVSVTDVTVDRELTVANVYVSAVEGSERAEEILAGCNHASGYLRSELAKRVELRLMPQLRFRWDPTPEHADHMEKLFAQLRDEGTVTGKETPESDG